VYAVQKPYSGCEVGKLVHQFSPMSGISMDQMQPDQIHAVFPDQDRAAVAANQLYQEHMAYEQALEEKKVKVTDKLKSAMTKLERLRSNSMKMIKENPKEAQPQREKVAQYTEKIDHLMTQLEMIEKSKKAL
jgi:arginine deiminase